jgi:uncharacterized protein (DUF2141 family)
MRKLLISIFVLICFTDGEAQKATNSYGKIAVAITKEKKPKRIYSKVEIQSAFPRGDTDWVQKVERQINQQLLSLKRIKKGKYLVSVQFVVDKNGDFSDIRSLTNYGYGMEEAVLRVLKKGSFWRPALQREGRQIKSYRTSIITMPLSEEN